MEGEDRKLGTRAFAAREWKVAFEHLSRADSDGSHEPAELEQFIADKRQALEEMRRVLRSASF